MAEVLTASPDGSDPFGVLEVEVRATERVREFTRRDGVPGRLRRLTVADATGGVALVLWGEECDLAAGDGPLCPGAHVRLRGATVRPGYRGGVELHLGAAAIEPLPAAAGEALHGILAELGATRMVETDAGTRFRADARIDTARGPRQVALWDDAVKDALAAGVGADVAIAARPNPALEGWFIADARAADGTTVPGGPGDDAPGEARDATASDAAADDLPPTKRS